MKTIYKFIMLAVLILIVYSCEYNLTITTQINPDGSITRTMVSIGDSSKVNADNIFPISIDSTWQQSIEWKKDSMDNKMKFVITVSKTFPDIDSLNHEFKENSISGIRTEVQLKKKFAWFFTKYHYTEVYKKLFPFDHYPITDYFTRDEIRREIWEESDSLFEAKMDSVEFEAYEEKMDSAFMHFYVDNFSAELINIFKKIDSSGVSNHQNISVNEMSALLIDQGEQIFEDLPESLSELFSLTDSAFGTNYHEVYQKQPHLFSVIDEKLSAFGNIFNIPYDNVNYVKLPGILLESNANEVINDQLAWEFDSQYYAYEDFVISAESRVLNKWTIYVSAIILVLAILSFFVRRKN